MRFKAAIFKLKFTLFLHTYISKRVELLELVFSGKFIVRARVGNSTQPPRVIALAHTPEGL